MVSHLFFADDSLLFARANEKEATTIINILQHYEAASGQMVNLDKFEVSYSRNVSDNTRNMLREKLGFKEVETHQRYLGLPTYVGRSKKGFYSANTTLLECCYRFILLQ